MDPYLDLCWTQHARERLLERALIISDVLFALRNGFVLRDAVPSTRDGYFKYEVHSRTPNSDGREVCCVVVPDKASNTLKLVTIFWVDETSTRAGTLLEGEIE
ncbi:MAG: DUF4258 domain-containing protein [Octadecabacter sp.]|nr:DUF4258 domain-containing protein [Octadecabacter sp.]